MVAEKEEKMKPMLAHVQKLVAQSVVTFPNSFFEEEVSKFNIPSFKQRKPPKSLEELLKFETPSFRNNHRLQEPILENNRPIIPQK